MKTIATHCAGAPKASNERASVENPPAATVVIAVVRASYMSIRSSIPDSARNAYATNAATERAT